MFGGFGSGERLFAPSAELWARWQAHDRESRATIDHGAWDRFLKRYVVAGEQGMNLVDYRGVTAIDRESLGGYIALLAAVRISRFNRTEQLAYWINLYNALTVKVVLDRYPVETIRDIDISPGLFADGPWGRKLVTVEGEEISLNDIEHRILRPAWRDNRVHYAVNCASIGCPNLRRMAFTGATVDGMLTQAARDYVNSPRGVSIRDGIVTVSKIYDWFYEDFGGSDKDVLNHLMQYAEPHLRRRLAQIGEIHDVAYDWRLNDAAK
jgi:hypothetical protein